MLLYGLLGAYRSRGIQASHYHISCHVNDATALCSLCNIIMTQYSVCHALASLLCSMLAFSMYKCHVDKQYTPLIAIAYS